MSELWSEGYFTDVGYTYGYYREISPVFQRFCLLVRGYETNVTADAQHCELGFGQGVSVNIHAAANPGAYIATDFNPSHSAHANKLAVAAGSGAQLYDDSFEQLLERSDLPQFDSISLHGIWTWVSLENHKYIAEFARRYLKPGGIFYVSYNCFPGWSPAYPLRQLFALHDRYVASQSGVNQRVESALMFTKKLLAANPLYAKAVGNLDGRLDGMMKQDRNYLAHEYFNREWNCMYFSDVVDALAPAKLDYVATAVPLDNVNAVNISADGADFLNQIDHSILREQTRDYFVNQQFRKDLYLRGAVSLNPVEQRKKLLLTSFVLLQHVDKVSLSITGVLGKISLQEAIYKPLMAVLSDDNYSPKSLKNIMLSLPKIEYRMLLQALVVLVGMGAAAPCQSDAAARQVQKHCDSLNSYICDCSEFCGDIQALASPVIGAGVAVGRFQQLFLRSRKAGKKLPQEWAEYVWQVLVSQNQRLIKEGKTLETEEENLKELIKQAETFSSEQLPLLKALRVA